jgi:hypothetical protein
MKRNDTVEADVLFIFICALYPEFSRQSETGWQEIYDGATRSVCHLTSDFSTNCLSHKISWTPRHISISILVPNAGSHLSRSHCMPDMYNIPGTSCYLWFVTSSCLVSHNANCDNGFGSSIAESETKPQKQNGPTHGDQKAATRGSTSSNFSENASPLLVGCPVPTLMRTVATLNPVILALRRFVDTHATLETEMVFQS